MKNSSVLKPEEIKDNELRFDSFDNGRVFFNKKKNHLPAMGWNSWNAFGSGNTEALTIKMGEKIVELGLDKLGYKFLVLDDGCYLNERVDGLLANDTEKFPNGFKYLSSKLHEMGLKFGMYNDIGTNLCAGAYVGTCGFEKEDAASYIEWGVDFLKVDNCYYLWDNATFSNAENAKYVYAPYISGVTLTDLNDSSKVYSYTAGENIKVTGNGIKTEEIDGKLYFTNIGTFDGTGPMHTPVGMLSGELELELNISEDADYLLTLDCITGCEPEKGSWVQVALSEGESLKMLYDDFYTEPVKIHLEAQDKKLRIMNHRRQENTLASYAKLLEGLHEAAPDNEIIYSMCEWGKTGPQNWAKKVGDSWRILNDITFSVGSDGNPGSCDWVSDYTNSVTSQYNKCVIMDEFAGLNKGWNDPDMMVIGMDHLNVTQYETHMAMWCMMNSPLMLGLDLRRVSKGDELYNIIANKDLIDLNQDALGVQAKRIYSSLLENNPDTTYVTNNDRVDILAKPLSDGSVALSFINVSDKDKNSRFFVDKSTIINFIGGKMKENDKLKFEKANKFTVKNLFTKEISVNEDGVFSVDKLKAFSNVTIRITPV